MFASKIETRDTDIEKLDTKIEIMDTKIEIMDPKIKTDEKSVNKCLQCDYETHTVNNLNRHTKSTEGGGLVDLVINLAMTWRS